MAVDRRTVDTQLKALGDFHQWFANKNTVKKLRKVEVAKLSSIVSSLISKTHSRSTQPSTQTQLMDVASQLERLAALVERGILTPQEFAAQKAKLLSD